MEVGAFCREVLAMSLSYTLRLLWETLPVSPYQKCQETCTEHCYSISVLNHQQLNVGGGMVVVVEVHDCMAQIDIL